VQPGAVRHGRCGHDRVTIQSGRSVHPLWRTRWVTAPRACHRRSAAASSGPGCRSSDPSSCAGRG
jgi:hypothetical protein